MAQLNANLTGYESQEGFDCLPPGWYPATVIDSEIKEGSKGPYINWTWGIDGKPNKVWDIMSIGNEISMQRLKTMATCCGHKNPNYIADTEELHGMKCLIRLKVESDPSGKYDDKNKISAFKAVNGNGKKAVEQVNGAKNSEPAKSDNPKMPWE